MDVHENNVSINKKTKQTFWEYYSLMIFLRGAKLSKKLSVIQNKQVLHPAIFSE